MSISGGISSGDVVWGRTRGSFYQSPFYDLAKSYLPTNMGDLLGWCQFYFENNPIIQQAIRRMSAYPITDILPHDDFANSKDSSFLITKLGLRDHCIDVATHYFAYGNAFCSILPGFLRSYTCDHCGKDNSQGVIKAAKGYTKKVFEVKTISKKRRLILYRCNFCRAEKVPVTIKDIPDKRLSSLKITLWNPRNLRIEYNQITGEKLYRYIIPESLRKSVLENGDSFTIFTSPKLFLDAIIGDRDIILNADALFHFARNASSSSNGWGLPLIQPVLRDLFYAQVVKKASETIAMQHINPLMIVYPSDASSANVYQHLDLSKWSRIMEDQIRKWRRDANHIPIMPTPIGVEYIGGQHRSIDPHPILEQINGELAVGMGVPRELLFGGTSFSASSVALRMLENEFNNLRTSLLNYLNDFLLLNLASALELNEYRVKFSSMRTSDDVQLKEIMLRLVETGKISTDTALRELGFNPEKEQEKLEVERKSMIDAEKRLNAEEGGVGSVLSNISIPAQALLAAKPVGSLGEEAISIFSQLLSKMDPNMSQEVMQYIGAQSPMVADAMSSMMGTYPSIFAPQTDDKGKKSGGSASGQKGPPGKTDMRPLPNQKPPRRDKSSI